MDNIKVMIVDDQHLIREGISSLLTLQEGIEVIGAAENGRKCLNRVDELNPDIILMDIRMPVLDGITATKLLKDKGCHAVVLMLTTFDDEELVVKSLKAGARGYLMKDTPTEDLARAIFMARDGIYQMGPEVMDGLIGSLEAKEQEEISPDDQLIWNNLTDKEKEILRYLARGDTNSEIAQEVNLSEGTVKNYISRILTALGIRDRIKAALLAQKNGWILEE
ncbi:MAG: response regulator transcription factor [Spirochaetales bacterium]|nr:response regulator transcription factor [Spirochaetales bacterium]